MSARVRAIKPFATIAVDNRARRLKPPTKLLTKLLLNLQHPMGYLALKTQNPGNSFATIPWGTDAKTSLNRVVLNTQYAALFAGYSQH